MAEIEFLNAIQKGAAKLAELIEADYPVYLFNLGVTEIRVQRDDIDPSRLKRAIARVVVKERSRNSTFNALVEYRGQTLVLSRVAGNYNMDDLSKRLRIEYSKRYRKEGLKFDRVLKGGKVEHYTLTNPQHFVDFLHYVKTAELEIYSQLGEHAFPKWIQWVKGRNLRPTGSESPRQVRSA